MVFLSESAAAAPTPQNLRMTDVTGGYYQLISSGSSTGGLVLSVIDADGLLASATNNIDVFFGLFDQQLNFSSVTYGTEFFLSTDSFATTNSLPIITISSGSQTSPTFKLKIKKAGSFTFQAFASDFLGNGNRFAYLGVEALPPTAGFTNLSMRTDTQSSNAVIITPDRDNLDDAVIFRCTPPNNGSWQLLIATSTGFESGSIIREFYGFGAGEVFWYGEDINYRTVKNGTYYARFQTPGGGIVDGTSLNITVNTAFIQGRVVSSGTATGVANVSINVWGPGGGYGQTDANGDFFIGGLRQGQAYTLNFMKSGYASFQLQNQTAGALTVADQHMAPGSTVRVGVKRQMTAFNPETWVGVNVFVPNSNDYAGSGLRFRAEQDTAETYDFNPATFTDIGVKPNQAYTVEVRVDKYGTFRSTVTSPASGGLLEVHFPSSLVLRKANVGGWAVLPSTPAFPGTWVSVEAVSSTDSSKRIYGGGHVQNDGSSVAQSSVMYVVEGLDPGNWTLTAYARGYKTQTRPVTVAGQTDVTDASFTFTTGGKITGTLRVIGDASNLNSIFDNQGFSWLSANQFPVFVNAWSPTTFQGAGDSFIMEENAGDTSLTYALTGLDDGTYEIYSFLPGFQLEAPFPKRVTVSASTGAIDLTFRALTGAINLTALVPDGDDESLVYYEVSANNDFSGNSFSGNLTSAGTKTITGLGTNLYRVVLKNDNPNRGLRKEVGVAVTNGQGADLTVDMRDPTLTVSGVISLQGNLILPAPWSAVVNSAAGLYAASTMAVASFGMTYDTAPIVDVYSFPLPQHFHGEITPLQSVLATVTPNGSTAVYAVGGLPQGTYLVRVRDDLNPPQSFGGPNDSGSPEFATSNEVIFVDDENLTVNLTLSNGVQLSGTITRPDTPTVSDPRFFALYLRQTDGLAVYRSSAALTGTNTSVSYTFQHLAAGEYLLEVQEESASMSGGSGGPAKYVAAPSRITVGSVNVSKNIDLALSGIIVGKLRDKDSNTLITSNNVSQFLPQNFQAYAQADPWLAGGYAQANSDCGSGGCTLRISSVTGQFTISRLVPGTTYDVGFRGFESLDAQAVAKGQKAYSPVVKSGVQVAEGQTVDLGVIDLEQGVSLSGAVADAAGNPLANIPVEGVPSVANGGSRHELSVRAYTDAEGKYTLQGIDRGKNYYDVVAAPRFEGGDVFNNLSGKKYAPAQVRMVNVNDPAKRAGVNFRLAEANGVLTGQVKTVDGGPLEEAFDHNGDFAERRATIILQEEGALSSDNPLGDIEEVTDPDGNFTVSALKPGSYVLRAISKGYITHKKNVVVSAGATNVGIITLEQGASISGSITKPDGTNPSADEVDMVVAVDEDFNEFVFGSLESSEDTNLVTGYEMSGFKTGVTYNIMVGDDKDEILPLASGITFDEAEEKTLNLVFRPSAPSVFATQSKSGGVVTVNFFSTQKLRNQTSDDSDLSQVFTIVGAGVVVSSSIASSRDLLALSYQPPANESSFNVRVRFTSNKVDPESTSGDYFTYDQTFTFFAGVGRSRVVQVPNAIGGDATLEGDPSGASFPSGSFNVDASSRVEVGVVTATDLETLVGAPAAAPGARALAAQSAAKKLGPKAYPAASLYKAVQLAPSVSPFSAFYDIFLPAGVSHSLKKEAFLTLKYDDSVTDPANLNIYYFDEGNGVFLLENLKREVDTENKTITVAIQHASTFVILQNNAAIVGADSYAGQEVLVYNFPNPFNLKAKTLTLANPGSATAAQTVEGTMIKYGIPSGKSGAVKIEIFNAAGELVRTLTDTAGAGGTYYYKEWNGRNDGGQKVASGVYIARFTLNNADEKMFKMAVVK